MDQLMRMVEAYEQHRKFKYIQYVQICNARSLLDNNRILLKKNRCRSDNEVAQMLVDEQM
eukprot:2547476-Pleurochrysis_carterae.AAC.4